MPLKDGGIFGITAISIFFINEEFKFVEKLSVNERVERRAVN